MSITPILEALQSSFAEQIIETIEFRGETTLRLKNTQGIPALMQALRDEHNFDTLLDISSLDHFGEDPRFEMVYELYGLEHHLHLRVRVAVADSSKPQVPSLCEIWPTANWHEREVYDMMGIEFTDHPDMRRILMWEGYPYFPLRKDFPLAGKPSDVPDVAFSGEAPLEGGPFVTTPGGDVVSREPRAR